MAANERDGDFGTSSFFGQLSAHAKSYPYTSTIGVSRIKNIRVTRLRVEVAVWFFLPLAPDRPHEAQHAQVVKLVAEAPTKRLQSPHRVTQRARSRFEKEQTLH